MSNDENSQFAGSSPAKRTTFPRKPVDTVSNDPNQDGSDAINRQASGWMKRGIALLNESTPVSLKKAISNFDRAIEMRGELPLDANPFFRYGLAAGWMNRGDAFTRLGSVGDLSQAVTSYDQALETLRGFPLDANPLFRRRLAIAWQNRGLTLQAQKTAAGLAEAEQSFAMALSVLEHKNAGTISDRDYLAATVWMNRANALVLNEAIGSNLQARNAASQAMIVVAKLEAADSNSAEVGLKARHILCQAIAGLLVKNDPAAPAKNELLAEATDAVESGMALARVWEQKGVMQLRPLAQELFRFGTRAYQIFQPHFLNEFLLENLDPAQTSGAFADDSEMHMAAWESLWRSLREIQRHGFKSLNTPEFERLLDKLRELRIVEDRLAELRQRYLSGRPE